MTDLLTVENIATLIMLILLQAVLGFDNLLYISLESKKAPEDKRKSVRRMGIGLAIILRIGLLFLLMSLINLFQNPLLEIDITDVFVSKFNGHSLIVLFGGGFIIYTAIREIWHMISHESLEDDVSDIRKSKSATRAIIMIVIMNLVFSFDSILSAMALTNHMGNYTNEMILMSTAIVISGALMIIMADRVANFLQKNRMFEVLGLFVLFIVGIMLLTEGGHLAHIKIFGNEIVPMNKTTFYFVIVILVIVDIVQGKYQKKLLKLKRLKKNYKIKTKLISKINNYD